MPRSAAPRSQTSTTECCRSPKGFYAMRGIELAIGSSSKLINSLLSRSLSVTAVGEHLKFAALVADNKPPQLQTSRDMY